MKKTVFASLMLFAMPSEAAWWIEPNDLVLRADIQLLSDLGIITQPITTYPLMWAGIKKELDKTDISQLTPAAQQAYAQVQRAWQHDMAATSLETQISLANQQARFTSFGDTVTDKAQLKVDASITGEYLSGRLSVNYHADAQAGNDSRLDDSFVAATLANWIVSYGAIPAYWGPSWESGLIQSNNARPLQGISFSRHNSQAFESPWIHWIGPWTFTTAFKQFESNRYVPEAKHWGARATIRPIPQLEMGASWTMMWGGQGYGNTLSDWWDGLFNGGQDESAVENGQENMLAGYDFRWSDTLLGVPYGIYYERTHEDYHREKKRLINASNLGGIDMYLSAIQSRVYVEYSDTKAACTPDSSLYNCMYEHGFYKDGYRYYGQSVGSTFDNDAMVLTLGAISQLGQQQQLITKLRWLRLNVDGNDAALPGGNSVSLGQYERGYQLYSEYQRPLWHGKLAVGADISLRQWPRSSLNHDWDSRVFVSWQRQF
ncbi:capsule assembly Wzi family protein [Shewanella sp. NIFS-20-20]|uniref:capsule assembly Wzi family protein n=1 Tax=Shewanella sp. NIFS-20-20 TaxID=2853806 RepID=UPI001C462947|nr:capsule assembly Wzi family protein [Shewanella sp. NIFS-20-20]MBV7314849.1 capsule assembly Wzi family protein [Shewanella sp. NIFS-20-20]